MTASPGEHPAGRSSADAAGRAHPPGFPPRERRPGAATAAAVLGLVAGGLLVVAAVVLFAGAATLSDFETAGPYDLGPDPAELTIDALLNLLAAGLLIRGGVRLAGRRPSGRPLLAGGSGLTLALSLYWLLRSTRASTADVWAVLFGALVVAAASSAWAATTRAWLARGRPA